MDATKLKELIDKVMAGNASEEEKVETIKELNILIQAYNQVIKEALAKNQN